MNLLERAKVFVAAKATKIALTMVPLAALTMIAVPAKANTLNNPGTAVGVSFTTGSPSFTAGSGSIVVTVGTVGGGANTFGNFINLTSGILSSEGGDDIDFSVTGGVSSPVTTTSQEVFPVLYNIDFTGTATINWSVLFDVLITGGPNKSVTVSGSQSGGSSDALGLSSITVPTGADITGWTIELEASSASPFTLEVPLGLNQSPEPSSLLLAGGGVAALLWRRKKKQKLT